MTAMTSAPVVGVDIGGTKISAGLVDPTGAVTHRRTVATPAREGPRAIVACVRELVADLVTAADTATDPAGRPTRIGVGTAGVVDPARGIVTASTDAITDWAGTALRDDLQVATGLDVWVVNDVVAFLLGERAHGAARGCSDVLAVAVGTGIGGALLVDDRVLSGHGHTAGEVGHLAAPGAGARRCSCGRSGHIEAVAAGPAVLADYRRRAALGELDHVAATSLHEVVSRATAGDLLARTVLVEAGESLGTTLGGLVNVLSPALLVLGGGVVFGADLFVEALERSLALTVIPALTASDGTTIPVRRGTLGADATLVGAAGVARDAGP